MPHKRSFFLIVDDEETVVRVHRRVTNRYFLKNNCMAEVIVASSGPEAIGLVREKREHFKSAKWGVLSDFNIPGMTGIELLEHLHSELGAKLIWRFILSGVLDRETMTKIRSRRGYCEEKPIDCAHFEAYLEIFISNLK